MLGTFALAGVVTAAAQFQTTHPGGQNKTTGTTLDLTLSPAPAAGRTLLAMIGFDNSGTSTPNVSGISVPGGETAAWAKIADVDSPTATGSNGCVGELWGIVTTVAWTGFTPTVTLDATRNAKAGLVEEWSGLTLTPRGTPGTGANTTGNASAATGALSVGDVVAGGLVFEAASAVSAGDSDTLDGVWSAIQSISTSGGLDQSNITVAMQHKIVTGTSAQTLNANGTSTDNGVIAAALVPV